MPAHRPAGVRLPRGCAPSRPGSSEMEPGRQIYQPSPRRHRRSRGFWRGHVFGHRGIVVAVIAALSRRDSRRPEDVNV